MGRFRILEDFNNLKIHWSLIAWLLAVKNSCTDFYPTDAFFDLSYAGLSQLKPNRAFRKHKFYQVPFRGFRGKTRS